MNCWPNFNQTWYKHSWVKGIQVCSDEGSHSFPRGDNNKIAKNTLTKFGPILTKLGTKNFLVKGVQIRSNEGPRPFLREDNKEIVKIH